MRDMKRHVACKRKAKHENLDPSKNSRDYAVTRSYGNVAHNSCGRKRRYDTREEAVENAAHRSRKTGKMLWIYHCSYCDGWHLSSHKFEL